MAIVTVTSAADNGGGALTTLREAISLAAPNDTIVFSFDFVANPVISLSNELTISKNLTIQGPGASVLTLKAFDPDASGNNDNDGDRIFTVSGSGTLNVTISGLTLTNGDPSGDTETSSGGAINNDENLTINNCVLSGNFTNHGGAIFNSGTLTVNDSTLTGNLSQDGGAIFNEGSSAVVHINRTLISNNTAQNSGGGVMNRYGDVNIVDSTLSGNTADIDSESGSGRGGALSSYESGTSISITGSTISGNSAYLYGGGIYQASGSLTITSSTISGNSVTGGIGDERGGGIFVNTSSNNLVINHSTIAFNTLPSGSQSGAGIRSVGTGILNHTIVSNNTRGGSASDLSGTFTTNFSLIGTTSGATINGANNQLNVAANLAPLVDNGGLTRTHAILAGSLAIDAGNAAIVGAPSFDQRGTGFPRIIDGNNDAIARIDIGAYELSPPVPEIAVTGNGQEIADGDTTPGPSDDTDFGSTPQGGATVSHTFTVRNDGTGTLTLGAVSVPDGFTVTDPLVASLAAGASDTLTVRLDTTTAGTKTGDVSFTTNDSDETTFNFRITGVVTTPEIAVTGNGQEIADGDTTPGLSDDTDFGSTPQGGATVSRTFTVRNDGTGTLTLGAVSVPGGFTVTDPLVASLAAGASDTLTVRLDTTTAGTKTGDVSFTTNDSDETTFNFRITGVVTIAIPELPGDYNRDGTVDGADYVMWMKTLSLPTGQYEGADGDGDEVVGPGDYTVWTEHFGETGSGSGGGNGGSSQEAAIVAASQGPIEPDAKQPSDSYELALAAFELNDNLRTAQKSNAVAFATPLLHAAEANISVLNALVGQSDDDETTSYPSDDRQDDERFALEEAFDVIGADDGLAALSLY